VAQALTSCVRLELRKRRLQQIDVVARARPGRRNGHGNAQLALVLMALVLTRAPGAWEDLRYLGMVWLRQIASAFPFAILYGEAVAGVGHEGIQAVFAG
jgi:hypothetical protein